MSRSRARRHRGRYRQTGPTKDNQRRDAAAAEWREARTEWAKWIACGSNNAEITLAYWREHIDKPQFLYFIQSGWDGPVKIGFANDPFSRMRELQCGNPVQLQIMAVILSTIKNERWWHHRFREAHIRGEWFGNGAEDVILELAWGVARQQMDAHKAGQHLDWIMGHMSSIWTAERSAAA